MHYIMCQSTDYVYGLMTGLFVWISLTAFLGLILSLVDISYIWYVFGRISYLRYVFGRISYIWYVFSRH